MDAAETLPNLADDDGRNEASSQAEPSRAEQLLAAIYQVCSHDLPNQLVIVQGLANLLQLEEKPRLTQPAQEHLARLVGAAQRAGNMVQFLQEIVRINRRSDPIETIQLAHLGQELRAELAQRYRARRFAFDVQWTSVSVRAGRRSLRQALLELLRCGIESCPAANVVIRLISRAEESSTRLELAVANAESDAPLEPSIDDKKLPGSNRLEVSLACALAATWGGTVEVVPARAGFAVCLHVPSKR